MVMKRNQAHRRVQRCRKPLGVDGHLLIRSPSHRTTAATTHRPSFFQFFHGRLPIFGQRFFITMAPPDARRIPGTIVHSKAYKVKKLAECARHYGSNSKKKGARGGFGSVKRTTRRLDALPVDDRSRIRLRRWREGQEEDAFYQCNFGSTASIDRTLNRSNSSNSNDLQPRTRNFPPS